MCRHRATALHSLIHPRHRFHAEISLPCLPALPLHFFILEKVEAGSVVEKVCVPPFEILHMEVVLTVREDCLILLLYFAASSLPPTHDNQSSSWDLLKRWLFSPRNLMVIYNLGCSFCCA